MSTAVGFNVHLRYLKSKSRFFERMRRLQPSTLTVMIDDSAHWPYIKEVASVLPETLVVARVKTDNDGGYHTKPQAPEHKDRYWIASPDDFLSTWGHLGQDNMSLYALNEPSGAVGDAGQVERLNQWF